MDAAIATDELLSLEMNKMTHVVTSLLKIKNNGRIFFFCFAALVSPKSEQLLQTSIQPYISSILDALMEPTSRGFSEVRDVFFKELVELSKNSLNGGGKEKLGDVS